MQKVIIHMTDGEPIVGDIEELPDPQSQMISCMNPRRRDGNELHYILSEVRTIIIPWHRITFIEVLPSGDEEEIVSIFVD